MMHRSSGRAEPTLGPCGKRQTSRARALSLRVLSNDASGIPSQVPMQIISNWSLVDSSSLRPAVPRYPGPLRASRPFQRGISIAQDSRIATCFVSVQVAQALLALGQEPQQPPPPVVRASWKKPCWQVVKLARQDSGAPMARLSGE